MEQNKIDQMNLSCREYRGDGKGTKNAKGNPTRMCGKVTAAYKENILNYHVILLERTVTLESNIQPMLCRCATQINIYSIFKL